MQSRLISELDDRLLDHLMQISLLQRDGEYFPSLAFQLSQLFTSDYAMIGEIIPGKKKQLRTLGLYVDGNILKNVNYQLDGTVCDKILSGQSFICEFDVQKMFPEDKTLLEQNAAGYAGVPLKNLHGDVLGMLCVLFRKSITQSKQIEKLLSIVAGQAASELSRKQIAASIKEQEQNFRNIYDNSPLSYQSLNAEGCYIDVNPAWVETFGYSRDEIIGRKFSDLMPETSRVIASERFPVLKETGSIEAVAFDILKKDGIPLQVTLHGRSSYDDHGSFSHTNCILIDVTKSRQAEKEIIEREAEYRLLSLQFQSLLDGISDRILLLDSELRIVWTNQKDSPMGESFRGVAKGELCYSVMHDKTTPCPECPVLKCFESGQPVQADRLNPDGRTWLQRAFPILDSDGKVFNVVEVGQDITDKIKLQKETARTGQLAAIGELAAGVAHEINNPINGVINYAQLLHNRSLDGSEERDLAERIIKEGDRIARIVKQLLFLSREDGSEAQLINLPDVLSESLSLVACQLNNEGIDLELTLAEEIPMISAYPQQLEQLFLNLISNARYALNQRYPQQNPNKRLEMAVDYDDSVSGPTLAVRFYDHGTGIASELLPKVLQPFVTSKPSADGTGLGLSLSNDIVKNHKGSLQINSKEGLYTEAVVRLPVS